VLNGYLCVKCQRVFERLADCYVHNKLVHGWKSKHSSRTDSVKIGDKSNVRRICGPKRKYLTDTKVQSHPRGRKSGRVGKRKTKRRGTSHAASKIPVPYSNNTLMKETCEICHKSFRDKGTLSSHKRVHTRDRPFKCDFCDKTFSQRHHRKEHQRLHTGEKPYICNVCGMAYNYLNLLKGHKRIYGK